MKQCLEPGETMPGVPREFDKLESDKDDYEPHIVS